jgi:hypothetical protein
LSEIGFNVFLKGIVAEKAQDVGPAIIGKIFHPYRFRQKGGNGLHTSLRPFFHLIYTVVGLGDDEHQPAGGEQAHTQSLAVTVRVNQVSMVRPFSGRF